MKAFEVKNIKQFMNKLLLSGAFDIFLTEEATLSVANTFNIDGRINKEFFTEDAPSFEFTPWEEIRPVMLSVIKGKQTPLGFKISLSLKDEYIPGIVKDSAIDLSLVKALVLNVKYENDRLLLVTGTSYKTFVMDKSLDALWDSALPRFLAKNEIDFEEA